MGNRTNTSLLRRRGPRVLRSVAILIVGAALVATALTATPAHASTHYFPDISEVSVPKAECGPGSLPEPGLQGDVSAEDRNSGRSRRGYRCNMTKVGNVRGAGGGIVSATFEHCS